MARGLLRAVRREQDLDPYLAALDALDEADLRALRADRGAAALAFWVNCYNAGTQLLLDREVGRYRSTLRTLRFFRAEAVRVAGTPLSLDDIEHGIIRGRSKYGLGYLPRVFSTSFERRHRLDDPDPRIHFALNCGAASCPAIRTYDPDEIDAQLDRATRSSLEADADYDPDSNVVRVPRLALWYRGDFGGRTGILELLRTHKVVPANADPRLRYRDWDWSLAPRKFADEG